MGEQQEKTGSLPRRQVVPTLHPSHCHQSGTGADKFLLEEELPEAPEQKAESWETTVSAGRGCHPRVSDSKKPHVERDYKVNSKESSERAGEQRQVTAVCQQESAKASKAWVTRAK